MNGLHDTHVKQLTKKHEETPAKMLASVKRHTNTHRTPRSRWAAPRERGGAGGGAQSAPSGGAQREGRQRPLAAVRCGRCLRAMKWGTKPFRDRTAAFSARGTKESTARMRKKNRGRVFRSQAGPKRELNRRSRYGSYEYSTSVNIHDGAVRRAAVRALPGQRHRHRK